MGCLTSQCTFTFTGPSRSTRSGVPGNGSSSSGGISQSRLASSGNPSGSVFTGKDGGITGSGINLDDYLRIYQSKANSDLERDKDYSKFQMGIKKETDLNSLDISDRSGQSKLLRDKDLFGYQAEIGERRAQSDFGRDLEKGEKQFGYSYKLDSQKIKGDQDLEGIRQGGQNYRTDRQIQGQKDITQMTNDQANLYRAQSAALAMRGLR